jgi:hypothetical protein
MNYILRLGTKLFMNPIFFNKGLLIEIDMIIIINFHSSNVDLRFRTYFMRYSDMQIWTATMFYPEMLM